MQLLSALSLNRRMGGLLLVLGLVLVSPEAQAAERLGLVIGEARYAADPLATSVNDAGAVAQSLAQDGFTVTGYADLDREGLRRAFAGFLDRVRGAGPETVAFVYVAGYGLQFDGVNYAVPVDARVARDVDAPEETVSLTAFAKELAAVPLKARVLVYDLARRNPFAQGTSALAPGLLASEPPPGTTIAFNAAPGQEAERDAGDYGLYAEALTEAMQTRGLSIDALFTRVRLRVAALSEGRAVPWSEGTVDAGVSLLPPVVETTSLLAPLKALVTSGSATEAYWAALKTDTLPAYRDFLKSYPNDAPAARVAALLAVRREALIWLQARRANLPAAYWTYMRFYPRGPHFGDARRALAALGASLEPPPRFDVYAFADVPPPRPDEVALLKRGDEATPLPPMPPPADAPVRRSEFYERLPPLLAITAGSLPLAVPIPLAYPVDPGRIIQPGSEKTGAAAVTAVDVADKGGNLTVVQTGADGRVLSTASVTLEPNGSRSLVQTGPDHQMIATVVDRTEPNGRRVLVQTGRDKQVISRRVTETAPDGSRVTTLAGPRGLVATLHSNAAGAPAPAVASTAVALARPTVIAAPLASAPPARPPPPPQPTVASTMPLPNLADGAPAAAPPPAAVPQPATPALGASLEKAPVPSLSGTGSPTISLPTRTASQPLGPPSIPVEAAPLRPAKGIGGPAEAAAAPAAVVAPAAIPAAVVPPLPGRREPEAPAIAEPVPPRRTAEAAAPKASAPADPRRGKAPAAGKAPPPKASAPGKASAPARLQLSARLRPLERLPLRLRRSLVRRPPSAASGARRCHMTGAIRHFMLGQRGRGDYAERESGVPSPCGMGGRW